MLSALLNILGVQRELCNSFRRYTREVATAVLSKEPILEK